MTPDATIKNYYLQFIYNAKKDIIDYRNELDELLRLKEINIKYLEDNKQILKDSFDIDLDTAEVEWGKKEYNSKEYLYNTAIVLLRSTMEHPNRIVLLQVSKYCNILRAIHKCYKNIELANKRKDMKFGVYRKYVNAYYSKVHKCVLQGMGYKFGYGIGTYVINHWKYINNSYKIKPKLDYAATNAKKKELLAQGKRLYDDKEAVWYAARHIPYDAVDYRVYKENTDWYEFTFIHPEIVKKSAYEYKRTDYVAQKYRGMSYTKMADTLCKTEEDIYNLQVDIRYKLNILLYKDPTKYLNFVRNASQNKLEFGAHNR